MHIRYHRTYPNPTVPRLSFSCLLCFRIFETIQQIMAATDMGALLRIIIGAIILAFEIPLFISLLRQFCCDKQQKVSNCHRCTAVITFISSIIFDIFDAFCATFQWLAIVEWNITIDELETNMLYNIISITRSSMVLVTIYSVYVVLLLRLHNTFQSSNYRITSRRLCLHAVSIIMSFLLLFILVPVLGAISYAFVILVCGLWIVLLTIGYIHLLYIFNHNLFLLVLSQRQITMHRMHRKSVELDVKQIILLSTIRKHTILGTFMISSNLWFAIYLLALPLFRDTDIASILSVLLLHMFIMTGPLCIYLGFIRNKNVYGRCCSICDKKCEHICIACAEKKLNKQHHDHDQDEIEMSNVV